MALPPEEDPPRYVARGPAQLHRIAQRHGLAPQLEETVRLLSLVLPFRVSQYASNRLHGAVAVVVHDVFARHGTLDVAPDGAFYVYPDFERHRERLAAHGIRGGADLTTWLLEEHGLAVLAGGECGDDPRWLRFRAATSLLYGRTSQQRTEALIAPDPLQVPHVAASLDRLDAVVAATVSA